MNSSIKKCLCIIFLLNLVTLGLVYAETERYAGICYSPFRDGEDPDFGVLPTREEISWDIEFIAKLSRSIRTYGVNGALKDIPKICQGYGVNCYPGAWISKYKKDNDRELKALVDIAKENLSCVKGLIVGNEVLLRREISREEFVNYIRQVKKTVNLPVSTGEVWSVWMGYPELAKEVDFILVHIHPYWEAKEAGEAADYVVEKWKELRKAFPDKEIVIGETGWPSAGEAIGDAVPSEENQEKFLSRFLDLAGQNNIRYFYFEAFDEKWKDKFEGKVGSHWGICYSGGAIKRPLERLFPNGIKRGFRRSPRQFSQIDVLAPFDVWLEKAPEENHFFPSGLMGDLNTVSIDEGCDQFPHSGKTCLKITYSPGRFGSWAGVYFQYPVNNWGEYPGYTVREAKTLTFWARGENGGEKAVFKTGGIKNFDKPYSDSFGPISSGILALGKGWEKYTIDLTGKDLSSVIGGFCWTTNEIQNPNGCVIYVDEIRFE